MALLRQSIAGSVNNKVLQGWLHSDFGSWFVKQTNHLNSPTESQWPVAASDHLLLNCVCWLDLAGQIGVGCVWRPFFFLAVI